MQRLHSEVVYVFLSNEWLPVRFRQEAQIIWGLCLVYKKFCQEMWSFLLWHPIVIKEAAESRIPVCLICGINMLSLKEGGFKNAKSFK